MSTESRRESSRFTEVASGRCSRRAGVGTLNTAIAQSRNLGCLGVWTEEGRGASAVLGGRAPLRCGWGCGALRCGVGGALVSALGAELPEFQLSRTVNKQKAEG